MNALGLPIGNDEAEQLQPLYIAISGRDWLECHAVDAVYPDKRRQRLGYSASFSTALGIAQAWAGTINRLVAVHGERLPAFHQFPSETSHDF